jgi:hypothetical protein
MKIISKEEIETDRIRCDGVIPDAIGTSHKCPNFANCKITTEDMILYFCDECCQQFLEKQENSK